MPSFRVNPREAGQSLIRLLRGQLRLGDRTAHTLIRTGKVLVDRHVCRDPSRRLRRGQVVVVSSAAKEKPKTVPSAPARTRKTKIVLRHADAHIVVVDKPAGLTTVRHARETAEFGPRGKRFLPATLVDLLPSLLNAHGKIKGERLRAVHRLDRETSGLVVLARTAESERHLGLQFRAHSIERKYVAIVRGKAKSERIESNLVEDRGDGRRGTPPTPPSKGGDKPVSPPLEGGAGGVGQLAITHVAVVEDLGEFTLVECRLETGRTHQVRIHLGERGTPLCGEKVYDRPVHGRPVPDGSGMKRPALHAAELAITHPATGKRMGWTSPLPKDMQSLLTTLRGEKA